LRGDEEHIGGYKKKRRGIAAGARKKV